MWVADVDGGVTHLDLREEKTRKRRYGLSDHKIGAISLNPTDPNFLLTASNSRVVKYGVAASLHAFLTLPLEFGMSAN